MAGLNRGPMLHTVSPSMLRPLLRVLLPALLPVLLRVLVLALALALMMMPLSGTAHATDLPRFAPVTPGKALSFPRDFGAHPGFRTEWWYVTGWLDIADGPAGSNSAAADRRPIGFQVTFFRSATGHDASNPSRFAPAQLIIAHAALSDPALGRLQHDQKIARAGFGVASASETDTALKLGRWTMQRAADGRYTVSIPARDFSLQLTLQPTVPLLLQGERGYSRKGPRAEQASYYYSQPQLKVSGSLTRRGKPQAVQGSAWLDHEWSSTVLDPAAVGWDWVGINLDDGGALMAFRIRDAKGQALWAHGMMRDGSGRQTTYRPDQVRFMPLRQWRSPRTGASYPVALAIEIAGMRWQVEPLQDDQELDSRASTGAVYWEGAVRALRDGQPAGRGYLEMTGYLKALKL